VASGSQNLSLGEAAGCFLASLPPEAGETSQQVIYRFVRWYGWQRPLAGLTAPEVANYAERLSLSDTDYIKKLELIRAFLVHAKKEGWIRNSLAPHLKARKQAKPRLSSTSGQSPAEGIMITRQGYDEMASELAILKVKRLQAIEEIRRAAADKDFRENAPLDAAREQRGQLEGRIRQLEEAIKLATVIDEKREISPKISIGNSIVLRDLASGEEVHYTIVSPREVDPTRGKISSVSPIGKAIVGRSRGEIIEVTVPAGKLCYKIEQINPLTRGKL